LTSLKADFVLSLSGVVVLNKARAIKRKKESLLNLKVPFKVPLSTFFKKIGKEDFLQRYNL